MIEMASVFGGLFSKGKSDNDKDLYDNFKQYVDSKRTDAEKLNMLVAVDKYLVNVLASTTDVQMKGFAERLLALAREMHGVLLRQQTPPLTRQTGSRTLVGGRRVKTRRQHPQRSQHSQRSKQRKQRTTSSRRK
jgi:hypothetical protein